MSRLVNGGILGRSIFPNLNEKYLYLISYYKVYRVQLSNMSFIRIKSPTGADTTSSSFFKASPTESKIFMNHNNGLWYFNGSVWAQQTPDGLVTHNWWAGDMSNDGSVRAAGWTTGRLWLYLNGVWAEHQPYGNVDMKWGAGTIVVSGDGSTILVHAPTSAGGASKIYMYKNSQWTQVIPVAGDQYFGGLDINYDGSRYAIKAGNSGYIWNSSSWTNLGSISSPIKFMDLVGTKYCFIYSYYTLKYFDGTTLNSVALGSGDYYNLAIMNSACTVAVIGRWSNNSALRYSYAPFTTWTSFNPNGDTSSLYYELLYTNKLT